ncbi:hypothetical protein L2W58_06700 [Dethiosulfovibrio sp. F2B]|uniref:hypothetical protein n=1 Tax=Dethiosulfovibrio faecalis TaxID=2720018 RepID=UPI001F45ABED|nr:hypothetical protein [Dethiosulfovibrio faecalis]MCF4151488.1 hypothetical protein [Dethiosulfovibrio faecalis]
MTYNKELLFTSAIVFLSASLTVLTVLGPIFFSFPVFINVNISGTALFSIALGPLAGAIWAIFLNLISSTFRMGNGIIGYLVVSKAIEAAFIGCLLKDKSKSWWAPFICAMVLAAVQKPISSTLAYFFGGFSISIGYWSWLSDEMAFYLSGPIVTSFFSYMFSCYLAYSIFTSLYLKIKKGDKI